jgi:hypothetical protein
MTLCQRFLSLLGGLVSLSIVILSIAIGWMIQSPQGPAEGMFFATIFPLMNRQLPATWIGHGSMKGVNLVPDDMGPQPRPERELFLELPNGQKMPQNGLGMCCRPTGTCMRMFVE